MARAPQDLVRLYRGTVLNGVLASAFVPNRHRWALLRACGLDVGRCVIEAGMFVGGRAITIGEGCYINVGAFLDNSAPVRIGARTMLGPQVMVLTSAHKIGEARQRAAENTPLPVTIGEGCWIGARTVILPGVTVGDGCVVGAGSVVTSDCAADGLYAGSPARRLRDLG